MKVICSICRKELTSGIIWLLNGPAHWSCWKASYFKPIHIDSQASFGGIGPTYFDAFTGVELTRQQVIKRMAFGLRETYGYDDNFVRADGYMPPRRRYRYGERIITLPEGCEFSWLS